MDLIYGDRYSFPPIRRKAVAEVSLLIDRFVDRTRVRTIRKNIAWIPPGFERCTRRRGESIVPHRVNSTMNTNYGARDWKRNDDETSMERGKRVVGNKPSRDPDFGILSPIFIRSDRIEQLSIYPKNCIGFSEMFSPALFDVHLAMINEGNGAINGKLCSLYRQTGERAMGPVSKRVG